MTRRVLVLAGGLSHERDVSLRSGRRVAEALREAGNEVEIADVDATLMARVQADPPDCVLPVLHGENGEDGSLREVLELLAVPYVGARPAACRVAFDKPVAKTIVAAAGLATPSSVSLPAETFRELGAAAVMERLIERLGLPLMVKPARGGSALGCSVVQEPNQLPAAMVAAYAYGDTALVERFITGQEVAVTVLGGNPDVALPVVAITPDGGIYDYSARYTAGSTEFEAPAPLSDEDTAACQTAALSAHLALGLRDLSRCDLILDSGGTAWFLETNVAPGLTETSTVPLALAAAGKNLGDTMAGLVEIAIARAARG